MLKRMVASTALFIAAMLVVTQVVIPRVRRSRPDNEARLYRLEIGRDIVSRACEVAGGIDTWLSKSDASFWLEDTKGMLGGLVSLWPSKNIQAKIEYLLHDNAGRIEMATRHGKHIWGIYRDLPWAALNNKVDDKNIVRADFAVNASSYFFKLPFKFMERGVYPEFIKEFNRDGHIYQRVRISFGLNSDFSPSDSFLADFDRESGRLVSLRYTLKEQMLGFIRLVAKFEDYQEFNGVWVPTTTRIETASSIAGLPVCSWKLRNVHFGNQLQESAFVPPYWRR